MSGEKEGTREAKRRRRAAPDPARNPLPPGCFVVVVVYLGVCVVWILDRHGIIPVLLGAPAVVILALMLYAFVQTRVLLARVHAAWAGRGIRCLIVHSDSLAWKEHIAERWIPRIGARAVTLNWSERARLKGSLEFEVFAWFAGGDRNFNPAVIVFRGLRQPLVFRFYYAFQEAKIGRPHYLALQEQRMFEALGV